MAEISLESCLDESINKCEEELLLATTHPDKTLIHSDLRTPPPDSDLRMPPPDSDLQIRPPTPEIQKDAEVTLNGYKNKNLLHNLNELQTQFQTKNIKTK